MSAVPNVTSSVVWFSNSSRMRTFRTARAATSWLERLGWKRMASRHVRAHGYTEVFFGKSPRTYESGDYAVVCIPG